MSSLAYHHMPMEDKRVHLARLKPWIDHFLLFEMDANNDTPDLLSPELALSVYQSYGRIMDFVYAHDAPVDVVTDCIDSFLMTEVVSILTQRRGARSDYHMLRGQWHESLQDRPRAGVLHPLGLRLLCGRIHDPLHHALRQGAVVPLPPFISALFLEIKYPPAHSRCHVPAGFIVQDTEPFLPEHPGQQRDLPTGLECIKMEHPPSGTSGRNVSRT